IISPVMAELASEARNTPVDPTSATSTLRCRGEVSRWALSMSLSPEMPRAARVLMGPAEMAFTRIFFFSQIKSEIANRTLQRGLGHRLDVIVGNHFLGAVVSHGDNAAAVGHERRGRARDRDQRVHADIMGNAESLAAGVQEVPFQLCGGRVGDAVHAHVQLAVL